MIQLATALNTGFATLSPFLGNVSERDRALIDDYQKQMLAYDTCLELMEQSQDIEVLRASLAEIQSTLGSAANTSFKIDQRVANFLNGRIRAVCMAVAAASLLALFLSSYADQKDEMPVAWNVFMYIQYLPFVLGLLWVFKLSIGHLEVRKTLHSNIPTIQELENKYKMLKQRR